MSDSPRFTRRRALEGAAAGVAGLTAAGAGLAGPTEQGSETDPSTDGQPLFVLEVDFDNFAGYFTECSGIGSENEVIEQKVVGKGGDQQVRKIPGRLKWNDITLKRGISTDTSLWQWRSEVEQGRVEDARSNGTITQYDAAGSEVARWQLINAWPSKVSGSGGSLLGHPSTLRDRTVGGSVEEMTLVVEEVIRDR